ncbi:MAG: ATP-binding protein, partial [Nostocoides sp.]
REALPLQDRDGAMWWDLTDPWNGLSTRTGHREKLLTIGGGREVLATARYIRQSPAGPLTVVLLGLRDAVTRQRAEADHAALISTVAHELRSPLTGVKGFSSTLLNSWDKFTDEQKRFMVETIEADADRLARLITDLLDVSRLDSGRMGLHPQPLHPRTVLARHVERTVAGGEDPTRFAVDVPDDLTELWADPDRFDQIVANLIENALRHGAGTITVAAHRVADPDLDNAVDLTVSDEGEGIEPHLRSVVFGRFWQGGRPGSTGLGLYLVKGLAVAHGGTAMVEDAPGGGARVRVRFPSVVPDYLQ